MLFILRIIDCWLKTSFATQFIGDIISYNDDSVWPQINQRITKELDVLNGEPLGVNLTFIAHSLGTVISSDYIRERQKEKGKLHEKVILSNFFTMGAPITLFSINYADSSMFKKPVEIEDVYGKWINILDDNDPIAYSIKDLNDDYKNAVFMDKKVEVGPYAVAHIKYWSDKKVHSIIAKKLAIDWLRLNGKRDGAEIKGLYKEYTDALALN